MKNILATVSQDNCSFEQKVLSMITEREFRKETRKILKGNIAQILWGNIPLEIPYRNKKAYLMIPSGLLNNKSKVEIRYNAI